MEVGVWSGRTLSIAACPSIGVDPKFTITPDVIGRLMSGPHMHFYQMKSDDFIRQFNPATILGGPIDMAFLDGMHLCEYLLRDFINVERHCKSNSVIALHDCLPVDAGVAHRNPKQHRNILPKHEGWHAGDVWRTALLLRRYRPDLELTALDAVPTGLVLVTNLNPSDTLLTDNYAKFVREMIAWNLAEIGIANLFDEMRIESTRDLRTQGEISRRFWL
jgi:hypothetical protein